MVNDQMVIVVFVDKVVRAVRVVKVVMAVGVVVYGTDLCRFNLDKLEKLELKITYG